MSCEPLVRLPLAMLNRHGLVAGATGTGNTKTLQLIAEQLSGAGVPVFLADVKSDVSGIGAAGESNARAQQRARETGWTSKGSASPVEFLSLTGTRSAQLRVTCSVRRGVGADGYQERIGPLSTWTKLEAG